MSQHLYNTIAELEQTLANAKTERDRYREAIEKCHKLGIVEVLEITDEFFPE